MQGSVTVTMEAQVGNVWALVSDITRIGEFSPETFEAEWLDGAEGPAVGHRFRGHVKRNQKGPTYWSRCEVTACEVGEVFEFVVILRGKPVNRWRYALEPAGTGTTVTESFRLEDTLANRMYWKLLGRWRGPDQPRRHAYHAERHQADRRGRLDPQVIVRLARLGLGKYRPRK